MDRVAEKQKFITYNSGAWKSKIKTLQVQCPVSFLFQFMNGDFSLPQVSSLGPVS
jgi:hypothetical protein